MQSAPPGGFGTACRAWTPVLVDDDELARRDLALERGADEVERAGLGGDDPVVVEPPERERAEAVAVAEGDEPALGERHAGVGALELGHGVRDGVLERGGVVRDQRGDQLGVGGRRQRDAVRLELGTELGRVREVPVVAERDACVSRPVLEERLRVRPVRRRRSWSSACARSRPRRAGHAGCCSSKTWVTRPMSRRTVSRLVLGDGDPGRLLPAVLEREEPEVGQAGHVARGRTDAEDAAHSKVEARPPP